MLCETGLWRHTPATAHIPHAKRANTPTAMETAIHAQTSQATHTTRAVVGQAQQDAVGRAIQDTIKVVGRAIKAAVACATQDSTASLVHATHAQTSQAMHITPATAGQAQVDAHGSVLMGIFRMETIAPIHITRPAMIYGMSTIL